MLPLYIAHFFLLLFGIYFYYKTSVCDCTDPLIYFQRLNRDNLDEIQDRYRLFCTKCMLNTQVLTKHCGYCNRCCYKFDHHCKWLNNCIGEYNYFHFLKLCVFLIIYMILSIFIINWDSVHKIVLISINSLIILGLVQLLLFHAYFRYK